MLTADSSQLQESGYLQHCKFLQECGMPRRSFQEEDSNRRQTSTQAHNMAGVAVEELLPSSLNPKIKEQIQQALKPPEASADREAPPAKSSDHQDLEHGEEVAGSLSDNAAVRNTSRAPDLILQLQSPPLQSPASFSALYQIICLGFIWLLTLTLLHQQMHVMLEPLLLYFPNCSGNEQFTALLCVASIPQISTLVASSSCPAAAQNKRSVLYSLTEYSN